MDQLPLPFIGGEEECIEHRYTHLSADREPFLVTAQDCARLTLPYLVPPTGHSNGASFYRPNSLGARCVEVLAAKLLITQFPPNAPFCRFSVNSLKRRKQLDEQPELKAEIELALAEIERSIMREVEVSGDRAVLHEAYRHLIVSGNVCLYVDQETNRTKLFPISRYVVLRDGMGRMIEIVVKESFAYSTLPDAAKPIVVGGSLPDDNKPFDIFTRVYLDEDRWKVCQELQGQIIPGSEGSYPKDKLPWMALRWTRIDGENYGRGMVEQYLGDFSTLEVLIKALKEGTTASAKIIFLVKPNSFTKVRDLTDAENCAVRIGNAEDVTVVQVQKHADFREAREFISTVERRLELAFMLLTSIQRTGERVTAEEIRTMAQELEGSLGGVYSLLSQELQLPYAQVRTNILREKREIPKLPKGVVDLSIVTGLEALGRGNDKTRLVDFATALQLVVPLIQSGMISRTEFSKRLALSLGIDVNGLIPTEEDQEAAAQQQQQSALLEKAAPELVKQFAPTIAQAGGMQQPQGNVNG